MRKAIKPEVYEYSDADTFFTTTNKGFAVQMYEYAKKKSSRDLDDKISNIKEEVNRKDKNEE